jgi:nicotinamide-nucleotide amidase
MNCEIVAVGSEMLTPQRVDTNSLWLTDQLNLLGVEVTAKAIVGDDRARLADVLRGSLNRAGIVLLSGGLGPTEDDVTRDSVAEVLGREQHFRQELLDAIAERFRQLRRGMAENNKRQAYLIEGAEALANPRGTAPGQWITTQDGRFIALLPGPPHELKGMFTEQVLPRLRAILPMLTIYTRQFRVAGMGESDLDQLIAPVYLQYPDIATTVLAKPGDIEIHLRGREEARLEELVPKIEALLADRIYSRDGANLETAVFRLLEARRETVSVAESCTGGLLAQRFTSVPGVSSVFLGGFVTYTNGIKTALLGVSEELLAKHTAVSEEAASAMAAGARARTGSTWTLSVTGYAGPDGGTEANPVGTVYIGLAGPAGVEVRRFQTIPERERVRQMAAIAALDFLRKHLH